MNAKLPPAFAWTSGPRLGRDMRRVRERLGLSVSEVARRAGVGRKFVYELESGKESLRADKIVSVVEALGLQLVLAAPRRRSEAKAWLKRNAGALDAYNAYVEQHGVFSDGLRGF